MTFTTHIMKYQHFRPLGTSFCSTYTEIFIFLLYIYLHVQWNTKTFTLPEHIFTLHVLKYQHAHPSGTSFSSARNEILARVSSGGYFTIRIMKYQHIHPSGTLCRVGGGPRLCHLAAIQCHLAANASPAPHAPQPPQLPSPPPLLLRFGGNFGCALIMKQ